LDRASQTVRSATRREIEREFRRLELLLEQIAATETERDAPVAAPADADAERVVRLAPLGCTGTESAMVLAREQLHRLLDKRKGSAGPDTR
jgi:transposase